VELIEDSYGYESAHGAAWNRARSGYVEWIVDDRRFGTVIDGISDMISTKSQYQIKAVEPTSEAHSRHVRKSRLTAMSDGRLAHDSEGAAKNLHSFAGLAT